MDELAPGKLRGDKKGVFKRFTCYGVRVMLREGVADSNTIVGFFKMDIEMFEHRNTTFRRQHTTPAAGWQGIGRAGEAIA